MNASSATALGWSPTANPIGRLALPNLVEWREEFDIEPVRAAFHIQMKDELGCH